MQVLTFSITDHRRKDQHLGTLGEREHLIHHLTHGLCFKALVVLRAAWLARSGVKQTEIVIDLSDRANRRTRIVTGGFLLNGNRW